MPKINGFELYIKIREKDPKVKICFYAIATFNEEYRNHFIQKPINKVN